MKSKAFALFEIILSVFLIGVLYSIVMTQFSKSSVEKNQIYNLKKSLLAMKKDKSSTLILVVLENSTKIIEGKSVRDFKLDKDVSFFAYDIKGNDISTNNYDIYSRRFNDTVNFIYKIYPNKSSTPMIMKIGDFYYAYSNFDEEVKKFDDLYTAKDYLQNRYIIDSMVEVNE